MLSWIVWLIVAAVLGVAELLTTTLALGLIAVAALISVVVPSAHEIRNMRPMPWPAIAIGAAVLAGFCVLEVGNGPPLNFVYFQF